MLTWSQLAADIRTLTMSGVNGINKSTSGTVTVIFGNEHMLNDNTENITVSVSGYDIKGWAYHQFFGPFRTEEDAKKELYIHLRAAAEELVRDREEAGLPRLIEVFRISGVPEELLKTMFKGKHVA